MRKFTVMLYKGSVEHLSQVVAKYVMEAENMDEVSYMKPFMGMLDTKVYYTRGTLWSDKVRTYDYGSYSLFIAVMEGDVELEDINAAIAERNK